jgi:hypothetical protein
LDSLYSKSISEWATGSDSQPRNPSPKKIGIIFACYNDITWGEKVCNELLDICRRYRSLNDHLKDRYNFSLPIGLVDEATHHLDMHGHFWRYLEKLATTKFTYQYNNFVQMNAETSLEISDSSRQIAAAAQQDSASMKTAAYLTLAFLPATFVCTVFSTNVFNFNNFQSTSRDARVMSPGWWVFVLCCILATILTILIWYRVGTKRIRGYCIWSAPVRECSGSRAQSKAVFITS